MTSSSGWIPSMSNYMPWDGESSWTPAGLTPSVAVSVPSPPPPSSAQLPVDTLISVLQQGFARLEAKLDSSDQRTVPPSSRLNPEPPYEMQGAGWSPPWPSGSFQTPSTAVTLPAWSSGEESRRGNSGQHGSYGLRTSDQQGTTAWDSPGGYRGTRAIVPTHTAWDRPVVNRGETYGPRSSWDPGSHQATTPATTTLATSLPAVQHQPLAAYYDAASPPFGFCHPSPQSRQPSPLPQHAPWDSPWLRTQHEPPLPQKAPWDSPWLRSSHELNHSNYGGGCTGSSYANEPTPYLSPPPPPRDGYYVLDPLSHTQPQPPWDSPSSVTTPDDSQLSTTAERETVAEREQGRGVTEMADEEGGSSMAENEEESLCAAARHSELETINSLVAAGADVIGVNGDDLIFYGKGSSEGFQEEEERREFQSETDAKVLDVDHPWWKRLVVSRLSLYSQAKEVDSFWCVLISAAVMGVDIIGHYGHKKRKRYALEGEVDMRKKPMINAEEVFLEVWRRMVIFCLYELEEVYKDRLNLHLEDKVILKGGGVDTSRFNYFN